MRGVPENNGKENVASWNVPMCSWKKNPRRIFLRPLFLDICVTPVVPLIVLLCTLKQLFPFTYKILFIFQRLNIIFLKFFPTTVDNIFDFRDSWNIVYPQCFIMVNPKATYLIRVQFGIIASSRWHPLLWGIFANLCICWIVKE